jgi:hemolysin-activating ACP:hemolysin acyltransferase
MPDLTAAPGEFVRLANSFEAFGMVLDLLSRQVPFRDFDLAQIAAAVRLQLKNRHHVAAMRGRVLIGYVGWMPTQRDIGEGWLAGTRALTPVADSAADALAVTIVVALEPRLALHLIREARKLNVGRRAYFKRGEGEGARKATVLNLQR